MADMESNKKLSTIVYELIVRWKKLNTSLVFTSKPYFKVPKTIDQTEHFNLTWKHQTRENFNK